MSETNTLNGATDRRQQLLIFALFALSLLSTITNLAPFSLIFVLLAPVVPYLLYRNRSLPGSLIALLVLYAYFLINTLCYAPVSLVEPDFYRRDGNFFVTFLPVLIGGALAIRADLDALMMGFLKWTTAANLVFLCTFLATGGSILVSEPGVYHFLFESHNAAGGFLSMVAAFALGMYFAKGRTVLLAVIVLVTLLGLFLTISRGSLLGLALAVILVLLLKERFIKLTLVGIVLSLIGLLSYAYPFWVGNGKPEGLYYTGGTGLTGEEFATADANTLDRVLFLWPRALDLFFQSPIIGTGFGSFDDIPYHFGGIPHVLSFNMPSQLTFSAAHAHNSYLHILGETGAVGFALLVWMLSRVWKDIDALQPYSVRLALKLGFWVAIFSSLTEHRLVTPSQMLPFTILFGVALACQRAHAIGERSLPDGASPGASGMAGSLQG